MEVQLPLETDLSVTKAPLGMEKFERLPYFPHCSFRDRVPSMRERERRRDALALRVFHPRFFSTLLFLASDISTAVKKIHHLRSLLSLFI